MHTLNKFYNDDKNNFNKDNQSGFRKSFGCHSNLIRLVLDLKEVKKQKIN